MTNVCRKCKEEIYVPSCKNCSSDNVSMNGQVINANSKVMQRYVCNDCQRTFRLPIQCNELTDYKIRV